MNNFDKLIVQFEKFPGVGGRQARRFVFHILTLPKEEASELAAMMTSLHDTVIECTRCRRFFSRTGTQSECTICSDHNRDQGKLLIVERDTDIQAIERSGTYDGYYFVLGGTIPLLDTKEKQKLRGNGLKKVVSDHIDHITEIVLGFSVNPDGENTARYVESLLAEVLGETSTVTISQLGKGLSTGSELEYADPETIRNAFNNRTH